MGKRYLPLALFGHAAVVAECPLLRCRTKLRRWPRSEFDPSETSRAAGSPD
jgi:hypothetical protein